MSLEFEWVVVAHCYREAEGRIRIISARKAAKHEAAQYRESMRKEYDFRKSRRNPYTKHLRKPVTIRLDVDTVEYFKKLAEDSGIPYQNLINLYLRDCASKKKQLDLTWTPRARAAK